MTTLAEFATAQSGVTLTTHDGERRIEITGGLLQVTGPLTGDYAGWRIHCHSGGGLAFNYEDQSEQTLTATGYQNGAFQFSETDAAKAYVGGSFTFDNVGGYGGIDTETTYYVISISGGAIGFSASVGGSPLIVTGSGTPANVVIRTDEYLQRDIGTLGRNDGAQVQIIEESDQVTASERAYRFGEDNYASTSNISRFQAGTIRLENVSWFVDTGVTGNNSFSGDRSDFGIFVGTGSPPSPKPRVTFNNCHISVGHALQSLRIARHYDRRADVDASEYRTRSG